LKLRSFLFHCWCPDGLIAVHSWWPGHLVRAWFCLIFRWTSRNIYNLSFIDSDIPCRRVNAIIFVKIFPVFVLTWSHVELKARTADGGHWPTAGACETCTTSTDKVINSTTLALD
jgi:hypothetical protein